MSPAEAFAIFVLAAALLGFIVALARWGWLEWKERRARRRRIEEHEDEFWRQVG